MSSGACMSVAVGAIAAGFWVATVNYWANDLVSIVLGVALGIGTMLAFAAWLDRHDKEIRKWACFHIEDDDHP